MNSARSLAFAALVLLAAGAQARPVAMPDPEQLEARADVICNGLVLDVAKTGKTGTIQLGDKNPGLAVEYWRARIKVLEVFKGQADPEITLTFPELDWNKVHMVANGPVQIQLQARARYRFYLKQTPLRAQFLGAMDGEFDDGSAVEPLLPNEKDNSPRLTQAEAIRRARAYVEKMQIGGKRGAETISASYQSWRAPGWQVEFFYGPPLNYPSFNYAAEVFVLCDRTISPTSWVGAEFPRRAAEITPDVVGSTVRLTRNMGTGEIQVFRGKVAKVTADAVTLDYGPEDFEGKPGDFVVIPRRTITGFQIMRPPPA